MKTKTGRIDSIKMSDLQLKPEAAKVGLRNYGPQMWFYLSDGSQTKIDSGDTMIVDFKTFERNIEPTFSYKKAYIVRDDSVLSGDDFPAKPTKRPHNAIFDDEIATLIKSEDKCIEYLSKVDSLVTLNRFENVCKGKRGLSNIVSIIDERKFMAENEMPENFYELNKKQLSDLMASKGLDIKVAPDDDVDEIREKIVNILSGS